MDNKYSPSIKLIREMHQSKFYNDLLEDELKNIMSDKNIYYNHIQLKISFVCDNEDFIQIGIYIVNSSNKDIYLKKIPLIIHITEEKYERYILEINREINAEQALFKEIIIAKDSECINIDKSKVSVYIDELNKIKKYPYIEIEIEKLPKVNGYRINREIKKFLKNVPEIEANQLRIDVFKVGEVEEGFCIIPLIRNSTDRELLIKSIPITVYTESGLMIYKGIYNINDNSLSVGAAKGRFYEIIIPFNVFLKVEEQDLSKYIVEFK